MTWEQLADGGLHGCIAGIDVIEDGGVTVFVRLQSVKSPCRETTIQSVVVLLPIVARAEGSTW